MTSTRIRSHARAGAHSRRSCRRCSTKSRARSCGRSRITAFSSSQARTSAHQYLRDLRAVLTSTLSSGDGALYLKHRRRRPAGRNNATATIRQRNNATATIRQRNTATATIRQRNTALATILRCEGATTTIRQRNTATATRQQCDGARAQPLNAACDAAESAMQRCMRCDGAWRDDRFQMPRSYYY